MRVLSFVGTRPELIKSLAFTDAAKRFPKLDFLIAHTAQNFLPSMADGIAEELAIPIADRCDGLDRSSLGSTAKSLLDYCTDAIRRFKPDVVLSNTDTDSAFYSALAASRLGLPVAHIEGGIRCEARWNPEEVNRRLADHLSNCIFTISEEDSTSLFDEGFSKQDVYMHGDITLDALNLMMQRRSVKVNSGDYDLLTTHRQENTGNPARLNKILDGVEKAGFRTVFPIHPRTRDSLQASGLLRRLEHSKTIEMRDPQTYVEMLSLLAGCRKVISDSGGLRREAYMLGKPVISLVSFVWFKKMNRLGFELLADADDDKIARGIQSFDPSGPRPALFGDGHAADRILATLLERAGK